MNCMYCGCDIIKDDIPIGIKDTDGTLMGFYHEDCVVEEDCEIASSWGDGIHRYDYDKYGTPPHSGWIAPTL